MKSVIILTKIKETLDNERTANVKAAQALETLGRQIEAIAETCSADCTISWYSQSCYINVPSLDDKLAFLSLAPKWTKSTSGEQMQYRATIDGFYVTVSVGALALPGCHIEEVTETVPARPAYTHTVKRIVCKRPDLVEGQNTLTDGGLPVV
jgi:hypothetical protein